MRLAENTPPDVPRGSQTDKQADWGEPSLPAEDKSERGQYHGKVAVSFSIKIP